MNRRYAPPKEQRRVWRALVLVCVMTAVFVALKAGQVIDWSWVWVLAPFWVPWVAVLCIIAIVVWAAS